MRITKNLVDKSKYSKKCPYYMKPEFFVVHNTANDASAANEIAYMRRNNYAISFHYAVDHREIVQGLPLNRNGWHAGDGSSGRGNRKGIGVEICYSKSGGSRFTQAEKNAAQFIASELKRRGWGIDRVKKHQDFSGKYCPHRTLDKGWNRFINLIKQELEDDVKANKTNLTWLYNDLLDRNPDKDGLSHYTGRNFYDVYKSMRTSSERKSVVQREDKQDDQRAAFRRQIDAKDKIITALTKKVADLEDREPEVIEKEVTKEVQKPLTWQRVIDWILTKIGVKK